MATAVPDARGLHQRTHAAGAHVWVLVEAAQRMISPPEVNGGVMLAVALVGAVANVAAYLLIQARVH